MTTGTFLGQTGISISAFDPIIGSGTYTPQGTLVSALLAGTLASYQHEILADGGWWSASMSMSLPFAEAEDWFENGLNRHIEVYNPALERVWAGFVDQVSLSAGTLQAVRGPLMDVVNRGSVVYTPILDATTTPPTEGSESTTTIADDAASQALYGILEGVIAGGRLLDDGTTDDAEMLRDTYIQENKDPQTGEDLDLTGGQATVVTLDLLGYVHRLQKWIYQDVTAATVQVDAKIPLVIAADPNGMFSAGTIDANALLASRHEDDNRTAWDVLQELVSLGDAASNRYTLGVYGGQEINYNVVPTTAEYQHSIASNEMQVETYGSGSRVYPWDVLPAQWLFLNDFLAGRGLPSTMRDDPRFMFIESVRYTAPNGLQLSGQKVSRLPQMLARLSG